MANQRHTPIRYDASDRQRQDARQGSQPTARTEDLRSVDGREWRQTFRGSLCCASGALRRVRGQPGSATSRLRNAAGSDSSQPSAALPSSMQKISIQVVVTTPPEAGYPMKSPRWVPGFLTLMIPPAIAIAQVTSMGSFALPVMLPSASWVTG